MATIGILSFGGTLSQGFPPLRLRALLGESAIQGACLTLIGAEGSEPGRLWGESWKDGRWEPGALTLPDVVMVQGRPLTDHHAAVAAWITARCPVIADAEIDKLTLPILLRRAGRDRYVVPVAELPADGVTGVMRAFLHHHPQAVVKAADGRNGIGLYFIDGDGSGWRLQRDRDVRTGSLDELLAFLAGRIAGRQAYRRFLVQRYISSRTPDGRAADIRIHLQRRIDGTWGTTRSYVRMAEYGMRVSNIARGGYQGSLAGFFEGRRRTVADVGREIDDLGLAIARVIDEHHGAPMSELGIDLAVDQDDRLWVIEANAFPQTSLHEQQRAVHTIGYARFVATSGRQLGTIAGRPDPDAPAS